MLILYTLGLIIGLSIALVVTMIIMTRPEKNQWSLKEESEDLIETNKNKGSFNH